MARGGEAARGLSARCARESPCVRRAPRACCRGDGGPVLPLRPGGRVAPLLAHGCGERPWAEKGRSPGAGRTEATPGSGQAPCSPPTPRGISGCPQDRPGPWERGPDGVSHLLGAQVSLLGLALHFLVWPQDVTAKNPNSVLRSQGSQFTAEAGRFQFSQSHCGRWRGPGSAVFPVSPVLPVRGRGPSARGAALTARGGALPGGAGGAAHRSSAQASV